MKLEMNLDPKHFGEEISSSGFEMKLLLRVIWSLRMIWDNLCWKVGLVQQIWN